MLQTGLVKAGLFKHMSELRNRDAYLWNKMISGPRLLKYKREEDAMPATT